MLYIYLLIKTFAYFKNIYNFNNISICTLKGSILKNIIKVCKGLVKTNLYLILHRKS